MKKRNAFYFAIAFAVFAADQATKHLIVSRIRLYEVIRVIPFFNLVYYRNTGSAFGLFKSMGNLFFIAISTLAMLFLAALIFRDKQNRLAYAMLLGGAAGNLSDRLFNGFVVDFLEFYIGRFVWPAFNIADSFLSIGVFLLLVSTLLQSRQTSENN